MVQYHSDHLEDGRIAVLQNLGPIAILPVSLLHSLLPEVLPEVQACWTTTKSSDIVNHRWKLAHEDSVFQSLPPLFKSLVDSCKLKPTAELINNPSKAPDSTRSNSSLPDAYLLRQPAQFALEKQKLQDCQNHFWEDIAVPVEYKKHSQAHDRSNNRRKMIWSMHHILRNDPCRRFTFGITIENTDMRIWLCNRATIVVTESFNFIEDHNTFWTVVASLTFADTASLGWDPTLRRRRDGNAMLYEIDVYSGHQGESQTFIADMIVSDFGAKSMQGRGTRVFRAKRTDGTGPTVVIKDVWSDHDHTREGDALDEIMEKMRNDKDIDFEQSSKHLLTVICHGDVKINGNVDHTLSLIMRHTTVPHDAKALLILLPEQIPQGLLWDRHGRSLEHVPPIGETACARVMMSTQSEDSFHIYHWVHYRIVFAQLGKPLHEIHNLRDIFRALVDCTKALKLMLKYDFIHRDVSVGNILYVDGHGILSDLEFAKRLSDQSQHDVRTGTVNFMAFEVSEQDYTYAEAHLPFRQNPLHDLESLWWTAVWVLFTHLTSEPSLLHDVALQSQTCSALFPSVLRSATARCLVVVIPNFAKHIRSLPAKFRPAATALDNAIRELAKHYRFSEAGPFTEEAPFIDDRAFADIHDKFVEFLIKASDSSPEGEMPLLDSVELAEPPAKRLRLE